MSDRRSFLRLRPAAPPAGAPSSAALDPYVPSAAAPWDEARARHLLRRVSLGDRPDDVAALLNEAPGEGVDRIVDAAQSRPPLPQPDWLALRNPPGSATPAEQEVFRQANNAARDETAEGALARLLGGGVGERYGRLGQALRERVTVLWSNHYVAGYQGYKIARWLFLYREVLYRHGLGDVRALVHEVGKTGAMLRYLDGHQNRVGAPNENYARELLELFTMGITGPDGTANYSQSDVSELARALTGWRALSQEEEDIVFDPDRFDDGLKTIFGRTEPFGYDDVVPLLFDERAPQIAHFLAARLYREFVSLEPDGAVIAALAARLLAEDFDIGEALRALLKSAHFFDAVHHGGLIKSPVELLLGLPFIHGLGAEDLGGDFARARNNAESLGQDLINPPDVAGWRDGQAWIDTSSLTERAHRGRRLIDTDVLVAQARARPTAGVARLLAADLYAAWFTHPLPPETLDELEERLLAGTPAYAWDPTTNGARQRILSFASFLVALPGYQLR